MYSISKIPASLNVLSRFLFFQPFPIRRVSSIVDSIEKVEFDDKFWSKSRKLSEVVTVDTKKNSVNRIGILTENSCNFITALFTAWQTGSSALPLGNHHPLSHLKYCVEDSNVRLIFTDNLNYKTAKELRHLCSVKPEIICCDDIDSNDNSEVNHRSNTVKSFIDHRNSQAEGIVLYTSGTTGLPKGVSISHKSIATQIKAQGDAWEWTSDDVMLHTLPLYHVHGLLNALLVPLYFGATVAMRPKFVEEEVVHYLSGNIEVKKGLSVTSFTGVPTMYARMMDYMNRNGYQKLSNVRLLMSGSAPLSPKLANNWLEKIGIPLLERYGCTETGMVLTNPLHGQRHTGFVGLPLENVAVRLVNIASGEIALVANSGGIVYRNPNSIHHQQTNDLELQVAGPSLFSHYLNREKETNEAINVEEDSGTRWYKTGDCSSYSAEHNSFRIHGRTSTDIIKSGGFKISALDIETKLSEHPDIQECAIVGVADDTWGEVVSVVVQMQKDPVQPLTQESLKIWCAEKMPNYWIPKRLLIVDSIARNHMGKINKKELRKLFK